MCCVSVCDLVPCFSPCCCWPHLLHVRQPGREEGGVDGKNRQEESRGGNVVRIEFMGGN